MASALRAQDAPSAAGLEFFESKVRPVLVQNCYGCHSREAKLSMGNLLLDSREGVLKGGVSGPALHPGKPAESLIVRAVRHEGKKMPPGKKLPEAAIADLERWVAMGAPDPREGSAAPAAATGIDIEKGRKFWAFQPVVKQDPPAVRNRTWARSPIDRFLLARMEEKGIAPVGDADRGTFLRRVTYDLTGLPPSPEELDAFTADRSAEAYATAIDRLLASPRFGERWGRHWLDVARYAESTGRGRNYPFLYAWRYRDYVIDSMNADKPFDRFIREQLAGDLLPAASSEEANRNLVATGFLAIGSNDLTELNQELFRMEWIDEQISVTSRAFLGLTAGCARCHDHKFDPIPTADYYALAGFFRSTETLAGVRRRPRDATSYVDLEKLARLRYDDESRRPVHLESADERQRWDQLIQEQKDTLVRVTSFSGAGAGLRALQAGLAVLDKLDKFPPPPDLAVAVRDGKPEDCRIHIYGDPKKLGPAVPRGFLQVLSRPGAATPTLAGSGRLQLADWIASADNPLTARVAVNRIWHQMFGRGIVGTVDNFGAIGERPSHPELLDYLAARFVQQGWSVKKLIREIALSRAYGLASTYDARAASIDGDNTLVWRMSQRRLEAEAIRDAMLAIGGNIDFHAPEGSPVNRFRRQYDIGRKTGSMPQDYASAMPHRSVYVPIIRDFTPEMFDLFDFPEPSETKGRREVTTVATQALFLMNNPFVQRQSKLAAARLLASREKDEANRIRRAYRETLGRTPGADELARSATFLKDALREADTADPSGAATLAWARLYQALFASAEFRYRL